MLKKYYILTHKTDIKFLGEFKHFNEAWEYVNYESNDNFVWLISEKHLRELAEKIQKTLG